MVVELHLAKQYLREVQDERVAERASFGEFSHWDAEAVGHHSRTAL